MGNETRCEMEYDGVAATGNALLETDEIVVRGPVRVKVALSQITSVTASGGDLLLEWAGHHLRLALGKEAAKWAEKIRNPRSVLDKLGVKPGLKVSVIGAIPGFSEQLESAGADVSTRVRKSADMLFYAANKTADLGRLTSLREALAPAGALWVIRPKGTDAIRESEVMAAGKAAGLVDVKVVRFSDTHTAEKYVIPLAKR